MAIRHTWSKIPIDLENSDKFVEVTHIKSGVMYTIHVGPTGDNVRNRYFCRLTVINYNTKPKQQMPTPIHTDVIKPFLVYASDIRKAKEQALNQLRDWAKTNNSTSYKMLEHLI